MANSWTVGKYPVRSWIVRAPVPQPGDLDRLRSLVSTAARDLRIFQPQDDGRNTTLLAYYDVAGQVVEAEVSDVCAILAADPETAQAMPRHPPYDGSIYLSPWYFEDETAELTIELWSDIWLPWVWGNYLETPDFVDNRELASRHTPRFNTFLAAIRNYVTPYDGTVELDQPEANDFQADDNGIRLDAVPVRVCKWGSEGRRGAELHEVTGVLTSITHGIRQLQHEDNPPPPPFRQAIRTSTVTKGHPMLTSRRSEMLRWLRTARDTWQRLRPDLQRLDVEQIEVDNEAGRHVFSVTELAD
jgi:hypothetical protein